MRPPIISSRSHVSLTRSIRSPFIPPFIIILNPDNSLPHPHFLQPRCCRFSTISQPTLWHVDLASILLNYPLGPQSFSRAGGLINCPVSPFHPQHVTLNVTASSKPKRDQENQINGAPQYVRSASKKIDPIGLPWLLYSYTIHISLRYALLLYGELIQM